MAPGYALLARICWSISSESAVRSGDDECLLESARRISAAEIFDPSSSAGGGDGELVDRRAFTVLLDGIRLRRFFGV